MSTVIIEGYPHWNNEGETTDVSTITDNRTGSFEDTESEETDIIILTILSAIAQKRFKFTSDFSVMMFQNGTIASNIIFTGRVYISKNSGASWVKIHEQAVSIGTIGGNKLSGSSFDISVDLNNVSDENKDFLCKVTLEHISGDSALSSNLDFYTTTNRVYDTYGYALRELTEG